MGSEEGFLGPTLSAPVADCLPVLSTSLTGSLALQFQAHPGPRLPFPGLSERCLYQHHSHAQQETEVLYGEWAWLLHRNLCVYQSLTFSFKKKKTDIAARFYLLL